MKVFLEEFFKSELSLTETPLGIQRCHRTLRPSPLQSAGLCMLSIQLKSWCSTPLGERKRFIMMEEECFSSRTTQQKYT